MKKKPVVSVIAVKIAVLLVRLTVRGLLVRV